MKSVDVESVRSKRPPVSAAEIRSVFQYDPSTGMFTRDGKTTGSVLPNGYLYLSLKNRRITAHRAAWAVVYGEFPQHEVDHVNRVRTDNRISNLRLATRSQNARNTSIRKSSRSGYKGVSWHSKCGKWRAVIQASGRQLHLGYFTSAVEASEVYIKTAKIVFGDFNPHLN
jgi:hypothetical protein